MRSNLVGLLDEWEEDSVARLGRDPYSTRKAVRLVVRFATEIGAVDLADFRPRPVTEWLAHLARLGISSHTRANALAAIRSFLRWAVETERLASNPLAAVRMARRAKPAAGAAAFTADELRRLVEVARGDMGSTNLRLRINADARLALYLTLATTGLRHGEARAQVWADIRLERRELTVTRDKARRRDTVPLCDDAVSVLEWWKLRAIGEHVFPNMPTHRTLERDLARAGVASAPGQWHRFRKASITLRAEAGVPVWDLTRIARHTDPKTTLRYVVARDETLARAAEAMPRIVVVLPA
jgi:integrase